MGPSFRFLLFLLLGFKASPIIFLLRVSLSLHFEFVFCNNSLCLCFLLKGFVFFCILSLHFVTTLRPCISF